MNAIETHNLTKVYNNNFTAVNSLNLEIPDKTIFGMLGPNGAGKTTTIKMLTCLIQPTSGKPLSEDMMFRKTRMRSETS